jgi:hypothetical protein
MHSPSARRQARDWSTSGVQCQRPLAMPYSVFHKNGLCAKIKPVC